MNIRDKLSGNEAAAVAMKQINPDVVAAFPITPSTEVPQYFSQFIANGDVDTRFVAVESEHSAMSACIGAQAAGVRAMTATSANGMAFMWEMLYIAASFRLPIVMPLVNRALSAPINIHNDHSDSMGARDSGWIQLYCENNQEVYDNLIQAIRIGEHKDVLLPVMVCYDGFITSHAIENIELLDDGSVKSFIGTYKPEYALLDRAHPVSLGPLDLPNHYFEHKVEQGNGMRNAKGVILQIADEFYRLSGRQYGLLEEYRMDDAEIGIVVLNSTAGTAKAAVNRLRREGIRAGLIKLRVFRPFPFEEIGKALSHLKAVAVLDKAEAFSAAGGPIFTEVRSAMLSYAPNVPVTGYIYGLGGRDVKQEDIENVYKELLEIGKTGKVEKMFNYLGAKNGGGIDYGIQSEDIIPEA
ncbi:pyruvate ferredoxin oxidoreductase [Xylanivirga thermophila]|jgi:pyruvate ferredoxin oxidoreductase alpha subunit|uniref:pyruvate ferredoxin oxidoreductase n=1 Tax=Xylanivirga thermophila TaxID=2496273 RepID=UPI00101BCAEE|nr:pyruvate ferredoxin oxidoreductase [Xylanivirga thermophila]